MQGLNFFQALGSQLWQIRKWNINGLERFRLLAGEAYSLRRHLKEVIGECFISKSLHQQAFGLRFATSAATMRPAKRAKSQKQEQQTSDMEDLAYFTEDQMGDVRPPAKDFTIH